MPLIEKDALPLTILLIAVGAVFGALSRYYITRFFIRRYGLDFPAGTLFVNLSGSFLMGVAAGLFRIRFSLPNLDRLVTIGFLGSYTTFSTYALEVSVMFHHKMMAKALFYWLCTPLAGFLCVELGIFLTVWLSGGV